MFLQKGFEKKAVRKRESNMDQGRRLSPLLLGRLSRVVFAFLSLSDRNRKTVCIFGFSH